MKAKTSFYFKVILLRKSKIFVTKRVRLSIKFPRSWTNIFLKSTHSTSYISKSRCCGLLISKALESSLQIILADFSELLAKGKK